MGMYVAEVNGRAVAVFQYAALSTDDVSKAQFDVDREDSETRLALSEHEGEDGGLLLDEGDDLRVRYATAEECNCWRASAAAAERAWKAEGWDDFDREDYLAFLVSAKMIGDDQEDLAELAREEAEELADEAAQNFADESAKEAATDAGEEARKERALDDEATDDDCNEAYAAAYQETYKEAHKEAYREEYDETFACVYPEALERLTQEGAA